MLLINQNKVKEAREILEKIYPEEEVEEEMRALAASVEVEKQEDSANGETSIFGKVKEA